jgi:hypothetical protein
MLPERHLCRSEPFSREFGGHRRWLGPLFAGFAGVLLWLGIHCWSQSGQRSRGRVHGVAMRTGCTGLGGRARGRLWLVLVGV